jgi:2-keto-3-deoxy-L-rhamnonate aldolase RhmA
MSTFTNPLKERLQLAEPLFGLWLSMGSETAAEALAHAGFDWLLIDMEHAPNDSGDVFAQLRAIAAASSHRDIGWCSPRGRLPRRMPRWETSPCARPRPARA